MLLLSWSALILSGMERLRTAFLQASLIAAVSIVAAFTFNAMSDNGINPFRNIEDVPVVEDFPSGPEAPEAGGIRFIELGEFKALLDAGMVVIDARTRSEYVSGHIPGALLMDYYEFMRYLEDVAPYLDTESEFAIYCTGPDCSDSELLARELYALGYRKIAVYRGGIHGWCDAGYSLETGNGEEF